MQNWTVTFYNVQKKINCVFESGDNGRSIMYGTVVRTKIEELWENEETVSMIGENYIYGIISNKEDYDEASTLRAWAVNWVTEHLIIPESEMGFNLFCGIDKTKLELTMYKDGNIPLQIDYQMAKYFEKNDRGGMEYQALRSKL